MAAAFGSLDIGELPYTVGDVTDPKSVEKAMEGCEALVHAASIYSLDNRVASQMRDVNATGTSVVLGTASSLGLDPIVYVSSVVALFPPDDKVLTTQSPVKNPRGNYYRSKADAERVARDYQERVSRAV